MRRLLQFIRWFLPRSVGDERTIHELHEELTSLQQLEAAQRAIIEALELQLQQRAGRSGT